MSLKEENERLRMEVQSLKQAEHERLVAENADLRQQVQGWRLEASRLNQVATDAVTTLQEIKAQYEAKIQALESERNARAAREPISRIRRAEHN